MPSSIREFIDKHDWDVLEKINGWHVDLVEGTDEVVLLTLAAKDEEVYTVRFVCDGYPDKPPKVAFVNKEGSTSDKAAWPVGDTQFHNVVKIPNESFLCTDLTREGIEHHQDWATKTTAWNPYTHTLMDLFNYIQRLLNSENYNGRGK